MRQVVNKNGICTKYDVTNHKYSSEHQFVDTPALYCRQTTHLMMLFQERVSLAVHTIVAHEVYS